MALNVLNSMKVQDVLNWTVMKCKVAGNIEYGDKADCTLSSPTFYYNILSPISGN